MVNSSGCVQQMGIIDNIIEGKALVKLDAVSACSSCQTKSACSMFKDPQKTILVDLESENYDIGEAVVVSIEKQMAIKAMLMAYFLPAVLFLTTMVVLNYLQIHELMIAGISILIMVPYYSILYINKEILKKTFNFKLRKAR